MFHLSGLKALRISVIPETAARSTRGSLALEVPSRSSLPGGWKLLRLDSALQISGRGEVVPFTFFPFSSESGEQKIFAFVTPRHTLRWVNILPARACTARTQRERFEAAEGVNRRTTIGHSPTLQAYDTLSFLKRRIVTSRCDRLSLRFDMVWSSLDATVQLNVRGWGKSADGREASHFSLGKTVWGWCLPLLLFSFRALGIGRSTCLTDTSTDSKQSLLRQWGIGKLERQAKFVNF